MENVDGQGLTFSYRQNLIIITGNISQLTEVQ